MSSESDYQWASVREIVEAFALTVDPDDEDAVVAAVREGMIKAQRTAMFALWVAAHQYLQRDGSRLPVPVPPLPATRASAVPAPAVSIEERLDRARDRVLSR